MLPPSPENDYSDFEPVDVLDNDIALLPIPEGGAEAFKYQKTLVLEVPAYLFGDTFSRSITWKWDFRIRESAEPDAATLFASEVTWTANIVGFNIGGLFLVTWSPGGDAGSGKIETTIIDGVSVNPEDGWKYVDTPRPTEFSEMGYTVFTPEGVGTIDTFFFFADWFSPAWLQPIPEGAILDANDSTTFGNISDEATYKVATKGGRALMGAAFDHFGGLLAVRTSAGAASAALGYEGYVQLGQRAIVSGARAASINEDPHGRVWQMVREADGWWCYISSNGNRTTDKYLRLTGKDEAPVWPKDVGFASMIIDDDGSFLSVAIQVNDLFFKRIKDDTISTVSVTSKEHPLPKKGPVELLKRNGKLYIVGESGVFFTSVNNGAQWQARLDNAAALAREDGVIIVDNSPGG